MLEHTLFINLTERKDRLHHVLQELSKIGINSPIRINAIKHQIGAIGCTLSHIAALEYAKDEQWEQVFICEDDITFLNPALLRENIEKFAARGLSWDVLIIGGNNTPPFTIIEQNECCRVFNCQTTTGYIVHKHYYDALIQNFKESVRNFMREPTNHREYALDIYWKRLQQRDSWFMILPLTVIQYNNYSDIEQRVTDYRGLMLDMEKKWLFSTPQMKSRQFPHSS